MEMLMKTLVMKTSSPPAPLVEGGGLLGPPSSLAFFLGDGTDVEEVLPLLGGCQGGGNSQLWMDASKNRVSPQYIELEMHPEPPDRSPFDPRALGHL